MKARMRLSNAMGDPARLLRTLNVPNLTGVCGVGLPLPSAVYGGQRTKTCRVAEPLILSLQNCIFRTGCRVAHWIDFDIPIGNALASGRIHLEGSRQADKAIPSAWICGVHSRIKNATPPVDVAGDL